MKHITFALCILLLTCIWAGAQPRQFPPDPTQVKGHLDPNPALLRVIEAVQYGAMLNTINRNLRGLPDFNCRVTITSTVERVCPLIVPVSVPVLTYSGSATGQPTVIVTIHQPKDKARVMGTLRGVIPVPHVGRYPVPVPLPSGRASTINPVYKVTPTYPAQAIQDQLEGVVRVSVKIKDGEGKVSVLGKGQDRLFTGAVEQALRQWKYDTGDKGTIEVEFRFFFVQ